MKTLRRRIRTLATSLGSLMVNLAGAADVGVETDPAKLVGQPVDIAPSAYAYRADRKAGDNQPESWLALMWSANQPLNKPLDVSAPAIKGVVCGLLWEEIRPVQQLELTWATDANGCCGSGA